MWDINVALPIAPTIEKSLAILAQDWDGDIISFYRTDHDKKNVRTLVETTGKPVRLEGLNGVFFVLHTDHDHQGYNGSAMGLTIRLGSRLRKAPKLP